MSRVNSTSKVISQEKVRISLSSGLRGYAPRTHISNSSKEKTVPEGKIRVYLPSSSTSDLGGEKMKWNLGKAEDKISRFFVTINTQQTSTKYREGLAKAWTYVFDHLIQFLKFREGHEQKISKKEGQSELEIGPDQKRIHLHSIVKIYHRSNLQLDRAKIVKYIEESIQLEGIYFNIKFIRDPDATLQFYIRKQYAVANEQQQE